MYSDIRGRFSAAGKAAGKMFGPMDSITGDDMYDIFSDVEVCRYLQRQPMGNMDEADSLLRQWFREYETGKSIHWCLREKEDLPVKGVVGIQYIDWDNRSCELSAVFKRDERGKGLVTEVMPGVLRAAFLALGMERVEIRLTPGNRASEKTAEKFGFKFEGILREYVQLEKGMFLDESIYSLLKGEYLKKHHGTVEKYPI